MSEPYTDPPTEPASEPPAETPPEDLAAEPTEQAEEGLTALQEAERRIANGIPAPNAADFAAAESPAAAQLLAEVALLMAGQPTPPEEAPTKEEFLEARGLEYTEGRTAEDAQGRTNIDVAMLSAEAPPKEMAEQRAEGASHLPQPIVPETMRSLSLEELAQQRVQMTNPGSTMMQTTVAPVETAA